MKKRASGFLAGVLSTVILFGVISAASATVGRVSAELDYNNIKVSLNGAPVSLADANGNTVEPFAINGTTYLPVRGVASALGLNVGWDAATSTVVLSNGAAGTPSTPAQGVGTVIYNENGIKITFLGFQNKKEEHELFKGWNINLKIENTSGKNYTVQVRDLSANGMMVDSIFSSNVVSGKSVMDSIWMINLDTQGITGPVTNAQFYFHIFNSDDWTDSFDSAVIELNG